MPGQGLGPPNVGMLPGSRFDGKGQLAQAIEALTADAAYFFTRFPLRITGEPLA